MFYSLVLDSSSLNVRFLFFYYVRLIKVFKRMLSARGFACLCRVELFFAELTAIARFDRLQRQESRRLALGEHLFSKFGSLIHLLMMRIVKLFAS